MNILAIHFEPKDQLSACQIYRTNIPFYELRKHGWGADWENWESIREQYMKQGAEVFTKLIQAYDIFVLPRVTATEDGTLEGLAILVRLMRLNGKRVIYEVDDDFTNKHRDLRHMGVHRAMEIAAWCDAATVTTPYLAEIMSKQMRRKAYILPNMVTKDLWNDTSHYLPHEGLVIGLSGSPTHFQDWKVLETVIPRILENDYGTPVTFRITGFHPEYIREVPEVEFIPPQNYINYAQIVRTCDLVLAPVVPDDGFNLAKSPIKVIEGMAATRYDYGAACIATDNPVYRLAIENGKNGLLVQHTPEAWYNAIDTLLKDTSLRQNLQLAGHAWVWKRHDIATRWTEWARAYQQIAAKPLNPIALPYVS